MTTAGAQAVTLCDAADQPLLEPQPGATPMWDAVKVSGLFDSAIDASEILQLVSLGLGQNAALLADIELVEDRAWVRAWMDEFVPIRCGQKLWVCPSHHHITEPGAVVVRLDPGLAFGTGTHPTTAMCLQWLEQAALAGKTVLDYGCGSGILAVAAALLGATRVWAVDIDPQALDATRENARVNSVDDIITSCLPQNLPEALRADCVISNILAGPLVALAPELRRHLRKSGQLALSGILATQVGELVKAYGQDINLQTVFRQDEWRLLAGASSV